MAGRSWAQARQKQCSSFDDAAPAHAGRRSLRAGTAEGRTRRPADAARRARTERVTEPVGAGRDQGAAIVVAWSAVEAGCSDVDAGAGTRSSASHRVRRRGSAGSREKGGDERDQRRRTRAQRREGERQRVEADGQDGGSRTRTRLGEIERRWAEEASEEPSLTKLNLSGGLPTCRPVGRARLLLPSAPRRLWLFSRESNGYSGKRDRGKKEMKRGQRKTVGG
ncbi:hypothetical protein CDD83_4808 [Cordyceps sp. RAO-2017]|nr:hypothetical protein CDD83_4808 [Cordyceps sp. RAO-2017]